MIMNEEHGDEEHRGSRTCSPDSLSDAHSEEYGAGTRTPVRENMWSTIPGKRLFSAGKDLKICIGCNDGLVSGSCSPPEEDVNYIPSVASPGDGVGKPFQECRASFETNLAHLLAASNEAKLEPDPVFSDTEYPEVSAPDMRGASIGSFGHPHACSNPCRYVWRKGGCRLGFNCSDCHLCQWQRGANARSMHQRKRATTKPEDSASPCPSVGSIGHPHSCAAACKYNCKAAGCKVGKMCTRCHLCWWTRRSDKANDKPNQSSDAKDNDLANCSGSKEVATQTEYDD